MTSIPTLLEARSPSWLVGTGAAITLLVGTVERALPVGDSIWVLSLLPIAVVTRYAHWGWGAAIAMVSLLPLMMLPPAYTDPTPNAVAAVEPAVRLLIISALIFAIHQYRHKAVRAEAIPTNPDTGLANSRVLFDLITTELERANRYGRPFTMAYVGIENLAAVRLRSGREAAEELVRSAAEEIRHTIRALDQVALLRDHEFALLLPETGPEAGAIVLDRMRRVLEKTFAGERPSVSFTVGAITWLNANSSVEELHQRTYQLMYGARRENVAVKHEVLDLGPQLETMPSRRVSEPVTHSSRALRA